MEPIKWLKWQSLSRLSGGEHDLFPSSTASHSLSRLSGGELSRDIGGGVDAFIIGSELRGLTSVRGGSGNFAAVTRLRNLASDVRSIVGPGTKISYAADWSEYFGHQPDDGSGDVFFHLDPLSAAVVKTRSQRYAARHAWIIA